MGIVLRRVKKTGRMRLYQNENCLSKIMLFCFYFETASFALVFLCAVWYKNVN